MLTFLSLLLSYLTYFWKQLGSFNFIFASISLSFIIKLGLLIPLFLNGFRSKNKQKSWYFLVIVLTSALVGDLGWIIKLIQILFIPTLNYHFIIFVLRLAWAFSIIQRQYLGLFIESLAIKNFKFSIRHYTTLFFSSCFALFFTFLAFLHFNLPYSRPPLEFKLLKIITISGPFILLFPSICIVLYKIYQKTIPTILQKQLTIITIYLLLPFFLSGLIQYYPFTFYKTLISHTYSVIGISNIILTF